MKGENKAVTTTEKAIEVDGVHPFADQFPMLLPAEMDELVESIKANGLRNPIVLTRLEDRVLILDGRNRFAACQRAEVAPAFVFYEGDDLAQYVIDTNTTRRNLTTGQRAMATALVMRANGQWDKENHRWSNPGGRGHKGDGHPSGLSRNTWREALSQCGVVLEWAEDMAEGVRDGGTPLNTAYTEAVNRKKAKEKDSERLAVIQAELPAVAEKVVNGDITLEEGTEELSASREVKPIDAIVAETNARTYTQRVKAEEITWREAAKLAAEWKKEWDEAVERNRRRIFDILAGWGAMTKLLDDPSTAFNKAVLEKLGDSFANQIQKIVNEMADNAATWKGNI